MKVNAYALEHSLELYEQYPTVRCRPVCTGAALAEAMEIRCLHFAELAPEKGVFHFDRVPPAGKPGGTTLLSLDVTPPAWASHFEDAAAFVRLLGAFLQGGASYTGVLVELADVPVEARPAMGRAFRAGFDKAALIALAEDEVTLSFFRRENIPFGLLLDASQGILAVREALATRHLQRVWETAPVLLLAKNHPELPQALRKAAEGWHVAAADIQGIKPGRMALRRVTYPAAVAADGALPIRFWWQVVGQSPLYGWTKVVAKLVHAGGDAALALDDEKPIRMLGDATHNQIVKLPKLPMGEYALWVGVQGQDGRLLPLAMDAPVKEGFYEIGKVTLDDVPRPELFAAWDHYYPEGYYPLEDPKLPY